MEKRALIIISMLFAVVYANAQSRLPYIENTGADGCDLIYTLPDEKAEFPGGMLGLCEFFNDNSNSNINFIPSMAAHRVMLRLKIDSEGRIFESKILVPTSTSIDKDILNIVDKFPDMIPAKYNGEDVCSVLIIPIGYE